MNPLAHRSRSVFGMSVLATAAILLAGSASAATGALCMPEASVSLACTSLRSALDGDVPECTAGVRSTPAFSTGRCVLSTTP